jgi:hypothetical protein
MEPKSNSDYNQTQTNNSNIELEDNEPIVKNTRSYTSPMSNSTDSSDHGVTKQGSEEKIEIERPIESRNERLPVNAEEIFNSIFSNSEILEDKKDFRSYLIYKIQQLSKLTETYFEASNSKTKYRGFLNNQNLISRIKNKRERKKANKEISNEFEDHLNTLKATYSDEEPLYDMIDKFANSINKEMNSLIISEKISQKRELLEPVKRPRGRPKSEQPKKVEKPAKIREKKKKTEKEGTKVLEQKAKQIEPAMEPESQNIEGSSRAKRNLNKPNYCEEEKITKKKKRATSETNLTIKPAKSKKEEKGKSKLPEIVKTELNINNLIAYSWIECEKNFNLLLSKLSQHELITFFRRLIKDHPECICFSPGGIVQLKIGPSQKGPEEKESRMERMRIEIQYYYIFSQYIQNIITFDEIPNLEEDEN